MYQVIYNRRGNINVDSFNEKDDMMDFLAKEALRADNDGWDMEFVDPDNIECGGSIELIDNEYMLITGGEVLGAEMQTTPKIVLS
jgi:hypothetical protein